MIVCLCRGISASNVRALVDAGATTLDDVTQHCGAGQDCGACSVMLQAMLARAEACIAAR